MLVGAESVQSVQMGSHHRVYVSLLQVAPLVSGSSAPAEVLDYCLSFSVIEFSVPSAQIPVPQNPVSRSRGRGKSPQKDGKAIAPEPLEDFENKSTLT